MVLGLATRQSINSLRSSTGSLWPKTKFSFAPSSRSNVFRDRCGSWSHRRCMSTDGGDESKLENKEENKTEKKDKQKEPKESPKTKLNDLLMSISKQAESKKAGGGPAEKKGEAVRLAVPPKEKSEKSKRVKGITGEGAQGLKLGKRVLAAVKKVAAEMEGDPEEIESELVKKLKSQSAAKVNISDLFEGMTVESEKKPREQPRQQGTTRQEHEELETSRAARVKKAANMEKPRRFQRFPRPDGRDGFSEGRQRFPTRRDGPSYIRVDLFGGQPLGIFSPQTEDAADTEKKVPQLRTWDRIYKKELKLAITHPPANGFEEMILWTEQEKLWKFPIDNEQGMDEEAQYSFADHVFLENYIESWCPDKGPIRNFMELVCVGLSKNSYLTVPEKHEYLDWYRDYFTKKSSILKEVGAIGVKA